MVKKYEDVLDKYVQEAIRRGKDMKHDLQVWRLEADWGELRCTKCGSNVGVAKYPPPGGHNVAGLPLKQECPS